MVIGLIINGSGTPFRIEYAGAVLVLVSFPKNEMIKKFLFCLSAWVLLLACLFLIVWRNYDATYDDENLLSIDDCLKYAENDVLGNRLHVETCPKYFYYAQAELLSATADREKPGACEFKFRPIPGNEQKCPVVTILISRHKGEG